MLNRYQEQNELIEMKYEEKIRCTISVHVGENFLYKPNLCMMIM